MMNFLINGLGIIAVAFSSLASAEKLTCVNQGGGVTECNSVEEQYQPAGKMTDPWCIVRPNGSVLPALIECKYQSKAECMQINPYNPVLKWRCVKNPRNE